MALNHTPGFGGSARAVAAVQFGFNRAPKPLFEAAGDATETFPPSGFLGDIRTAVFNRSIERIVVDADVGATVIEELERSFRLQGPVGFTAMPRWFERNSKHVVFSSRGEFDRQWPWGSSRWPIFRREWARATTALDQLLLDSPAEPMYVINVHAAPPDMGASQPFEECTERFFESEGFRMAGTVVFHVTNLLPWLEAPVELPRFLSSLLHTNHIKNGQTTKVVFVADQRAFDRARDVLRLTFKETRVVGPPRRWWQFG